MKNFLTSIVCVSVAVIIGMYISYTLGWTINKYYVFTDIIKDNGDPVVLNEEEMDNFTKRIKELKNETIPSLE